MSTTSSQNIGLEYLNPDDKNKILAATVYIKKAIHTKTQPKAAPYDQIIDKLASWHLPPQTFYTFIASLLNQLNIPFPEKIDLPLNPEICQAANQVTRFIRLRVIATDEESRKRITWANKLRGLFDFAYNEPDLILILIADHIIKMQNAEVLDHTEKRILFEENEAVFLPLIEFLGMWDLRRKMGNVSLSFLNPGKMWTKITEGQKQYTQKQLNLYEQIQNKLEEQQKGIIQAEIIPHYSSPSSIYRRLLRGESLYTILRQIRFKILVQSEEDCYRTLSLIHRLWEPVSGKTYIGENFRDQVSTPKFNSYRALVTQISYPVGLDQQAFTAVEFRIFTKEMELGNSLGIIAYRYLLDPPRKLKNVWWEDETLRHFMQEHPLGSSSKEIYVFSPIGKVYRGLPTGSTPIDYAYNIHSEVGNHCKRIWINGQTAPYEQRLVNGDLVEIEVDPLYQGPDERWLKIVKTKTAINHIKRGIVKSAPAPGRQVIDKALNSELSLYELRNEVSASRIEAFIESTAKHFGYSNKDALYLDIAEPENALRRDKVVPEVLVSHFITRYLIDHIARADGLPLPPVDNVRFVHCEHGVSKRVVPGIKIVGRIVHRKGPEALVTEYLSVYRADCPYVTSIPETEKVHLEWLGDRRKGDPFSLIVNAVDRPGLLEQLLKKIYSLYDEKMYLLAMHAEVQPDNNAHITMTIDAPNFQIMQSLNDRFEEIRRSGLINDYQFHTLSPLEKLRLRSPDIIPNPFTTGPAFNTQIFKGRDYEIAKIIGAMEGGQNLIILFGINRVGKTSLLRFTQNHIATEHNFTAAFVDLQGLIAYDEQAFWTELAQQIVGAIRAQPELRGATIRGYPFKSKENAYEAFIHLWKEIKTLLEGRKLIILVDEFSMVDEVWTNKLEANRLVMRLKSLVESEDRLYWVICVQETLYRQSTDMKRNLSLASPSLLRTGIPVRVEFIDQTSARKLIEDPVGQMLNFDEDVKEKILAVTACHPYFLQNLLHEIVAQANYGHQRHITMEQLDKAVSQLMTLEIIFQSFTTRFDWPNKDILSALAMLSGDDNRPVSIVSLYQTVRNCKPLISFRALVTTLESLCDAGVLSKHDERSRQTVSIHVPLFREWLVRNHPFSVG